jgi:3-oxoacyl-[acyl-carrier-protein] synthase-1
VTLYVGLPRPGKQAEGWRERFLCDLGECAGLQVDPIHSRAFPNGRAGAIMALEAALQSLTEDAGRTVVVGGVDSFLNLRRIAELDLEGRILGPRVMDGFIPGEGAAFLVLKGAPDPTGSQVTLLGAAEVTDRGHRYGDDPAKGEGLANALTRMRDVLRSDHGPVRTTWAGFNGENFDAKLWGVARLRHADFFAPDMVMQHPADCIGDTGAAAGAILTALAEFGLRQSLRDGPALIWAASDHEDCGCALLGRDV